MTISTIEEIRHHAGQRLRMEGDRSTWTVADDGETISNGEVTLSLSVMLARHDTFTLDDGVAEVGDFFTSGRYGYFVRAVEGDRLHWFTFARNEAGEWALVNAYDSGILPTFSDPGNFTRAEVPRPMVDVVTRMYNAETERDRLRGQPAEARATATPLFDRDGFNEALIEWMENHEQEENHALRGIMENYGMSTPTITEDIEVKVEVSGSVEVDVEAPDFSTEITGVPASVRGEFEVTVYVTKRGESGECMCDEVDVDDVRRALRSAGHEDLVHEFDNWSPNCGDG